MDTWERAVVKIQHVFRTALVATLGVGVGILILTGVQTLSTVFLYIGTALFLALGLDPVVSFFERRGLPRWAALLATFAALVAIATALVLIVVPVLVDQIAKLVQQTQRLVDSAIDGQWNPITVVSSWLSDTFPLLQVDMVLDYVNDWWNGLDFNDIGASLGSGLLSFGAGIVAIATGTIIVLILTIYFTASMRSLKRSVYQLAPASKRERFVGLSEQITASVGYYVMGQVVLGAINAYIRPVIQLLTLPLSCLTFGLFSVVVNVALFGLAAYLVPGVSVTVLGAVVGAVITSVLSGIIFSILDEK